jgi:hypothetical protein
VTFIWPRGGEVYVETYAELGLWPVKRIYVPLVQK